MKLFNASIFRRFRTKNRISAHDPHTGQEKWYIFLSPLNLVTALVALLVVLFVAVITIIAFTPALDMVPGYPGAKTRTMLIEYNMKLDSLEHELTLWNNYYLNLKRIMDGQPTAVVESPRPDSVVAAAGEISRIAEDSILRAQIEGDGPYALRPTASGGGADYPEMYPPVKGVVTAKFDPRVGRFGTQIAVAENQPVMALMEGVVFNASWTPDKGEVIYILHPGNIISAYLYNAQLTKQTGDRVYSGEVVGFTGTSTTGQADAGYSEVQLWINGTPVDPENYLIF
ncbi:MAG: M23 family metallopeptidase [Rikenellaceae bacterium]|jgi:murein DD-endopeptidase MepM/ murein hydrolase activator NlpD|nr:M23 family metallopeptidase [Rikenellaceae bacterium]